MTTPTRPTRSDPRRRTRVLVVGEDERAAAVTPRLTGPLVRVDDVFAALGALASDDTPFDVVLIDHGLVDGDAARAAQAMRRVDPSLRIVLMTDRVTVDREAFDACVRLPDDLGRLEQVVCDAVDEGPAEGAPETAGATTVDPVPTADAVPPPVDTPPPSPPPAPQTPERPAPPVALPQEDHREARRPPRSTRTATTTASEELGDIDLVERLLQRGGNVLETALRLIVQQTGWSDVRLGTSGEAEPSGAPPGQAEVVHDQDRFGWLRSNLASADQLRPWAAWLARWLALERTHARFRLMAYQDDLTGAWNRRFFDAFLGETLEEARRLRRPVSVMVFDIDDFKRYNDEFGHTAGDTVLIETVRLLNSVIRKGDRVCRMGGDEFAVIFADLEGPRELGSSHPSSPEQIAQRFQDQIRQMRFPKLGAEAPGNLSISAGLATFPWDGMTPMQLADCADRRALQSKQRGKNVITYGPERD